YSGIVGNKEADRLVLLGSRKKKYKLEFEFQPVIKKDLIKNYF
ncbi:13845_t:CDS:1, partial [Dentiscutata heterogama]